MRTQKFAAGMIAAALGWAASAGPASATVFGIDAFAVIKNGSPIFIDSFSDGLAPPDTSGASPGITCPAAPNCYGTQGTFSEGGGRALMDTSLGAPSTSPIGISFLSLGAVLLTNTDPTNTTLGLKSNATFSVRGLFDLTMPAVEREAYGVRLTDRVLAGPQAQAGNDILEMVVVMQPGTQDILIQFRALDFVGGSVTIIDSVNLGSVTALGDDQILLDLTRGSTSSNDVTASYQLWDGGVGGGVTAFGNLGQIFSDENWTRAQFVAYTPTEVPEPATLGLFGLALAGLCALRRRYA